MSAREQILADVRRALDGSGGAVSVPRDYRVDLDVMDVLGLFAERVADYRATVEHCPAGQVETAIARALGGSSVVVPHDLPWTVPGAVIDARHTAAELDRIDAVVTAAAVGIATTGTVVLDHGVGQGRRAITLVPDLHVLVVRAAQVVLGVPEAIARLDPLRPQTWISGPSATSDIELTRVEGVHGPRQLRVIVVDG